MGLLTVTPLEPTPGRGPLGRTWTLVDSGRNLHEPVAASFFIVQVASPRPTNHKWFKRVRTKIFCIQPWFF